MAFADFTEHRQVVALLQRSLERGRLGHAYLFTGSTLENLEAVARALAKTLNCQNPPQRANSGVALDSCDRCLACRKLDGDNHPDAQWVRPESKSRIITVEQMRDLMQTIHLKPNEAQYKVAIIVAADRLNVQAANAFLKTLEEPPPKSVLMLLSTEPQRLLETILSRCLRLNFGGDATRPFNAAHRGWLNSFSESAAREQQGLLSRYRLLGVLLAELGKLRAKIEADLTARSPAERYDDVDPRLRERWAEELSAAIEAEYRRQRAEVLAILHWWLRDVWLQTLQLGGQRLGFPDLAAAVDTVARRITPREATENLQVIEQTQKLLYSNVQEALALEVGLLKLKL